MTRLHVEGEVQSPLAFGFPELRALSDQVEDVSRLIPGREGSAVRLQTVLEQVGPKETVRYITLESTDGKFSASVPLEAVQEGHYRLSLQRCGPAGEQRRAVSFFYSKRCGVPCG